MPRWVRPLGQAALTIGVLAAIVAAVDLSAVAEAVRAALLRDPAVWQGVTSLDTGAPSLEDAFLDLTGHETGAAQDA